MPPPILTVGQVTRQIKDALEGNFPQVWVQGEISNCTRAGSGHYYLTLKDEAAQLRAIVWRNTAARLKFEIHDGLEVVAAGPIEVYEARGSYQMVIEQLVPQGIGGLELAFRQICEKLEKEGLFDTARKRPLPRFPRRIALITSPSGAAVRDMLQVLGRRWRGTEVVLLPVAVQGSGAAEQIAAALRMVHRLSGVDVVIVGRGGGSIEDLWAFNEEIVARAIHACQVPVISAVGHEIDVTVADLVADRRALTPSEGAELAVPHREEMRGELQRLRGRLIQALQGRARQSRQLLDHLRRHRCLTKPLERVHELSHLVDDLEARAVRAIRRRVERAQAQVASGSGQLQALSPLHVLHRGYSVTRTRIGREVVRHSAELQPGDEVETLLSQGSILSRVLDTHPPAARIVPFNSAASISDKPDVAPALPANSRSANPEPGESSASS